MTNILPENSARLIFKINKQPCVLPDEVSILPDDDGKGYYWEWCGKKGESFDTEKLALIDWVNRIYKDPEMLRESTKGEDESNKKKPPLKDFSLLTLPTEYQSERWRPIYGRNTRGIQ